MTSNQENFPTMINLTSVLNKGNTNKSMTLYGAIIGSKD